MGGPYNRIFRDLYPNDVKGLVFLDSSHPEQEERLAPSDFPKKVVAYKLLSIVADTGIMGLYNKIIGVKLSKDLPKDCQTRERYLYFYSGKVIRRMIKESNFIDNILLRAGQTSSLDSLPVLVFTATKQYKEWQKEKYRNKGIDPDRELQLWFEMQQELKELSTNGKQFDIDGSHSSIITKKENAEIINKEILLMAQKNKKKS